MKQILIIIMVTMFLAGCGRKGQLISPDALVPAVVQNMQVRQQGEDFRITWQAPGKEKSGRPLRDLAGFHLMRRVIAGDNSNCASCDDSWKLLSTIDLDLPGNITRSGPTFFYFDRGTPLGTSSQYRLLAFSRSGGNSAPLTSPPRKMLPAVAAPAIKEEMLPASIKIAFTFTPPADAKLLGFNIYRRQMTDEPRLLPLNSTPVAQNFWEDQQLQFGQTYRYSATALVEIGGETVESLPSAELALLFSLQEIR